MAVVVNPIIGIAVMLFAMVRAMVLEASGVKSAILKCFFKSWLTGVLL